MDHDDRRDIVRRLFTMAGTRLETATTSAGAGQASGLTAAEASALANDLALAAQELVTLSDAIVLLAEGF